MSQPPIASHSFFCSISRPLTLSASLVLLFGWFTHSARIPSHPNQAEPQKKMIVLYTCINRRCDGKILLGTENLWGGTFYDFFSLSFFLHFFDIFAVATTEAEATVLPVSVVYIQFCCRSFESFASFFFFFSVLSQTNTNHLLYVRNFCCSSAFKRNETCMRYYDFRLLAYARWFSFLSLLLVGALFCVCR